MAEKLSLAMILVGRVSATADKGLTYLYSLIGFKRPLIKRA
jgi:hypothetical protein